MSGLSPTQASLTKAEKVKLAAALLDAARSDDGKFPLEDLFAALIAPQPQPEGMEERDHLFNEYRRASSLDLQAFSAYRSVSAETRRRSDVWDNAPGGIMEKYRSQDEGNARRAAYDAEQAQLAGEAHEARQ